MVFHKFTNRRTKSFTWFQASHINFFCPHSACHAQSYRLNEQSFPDCAERLLSLEHYFAFWTHLRTFSHVGQHLSNISHFEQISSNRCLLNFKVVWYPKIWWFSWKIQWYKFFYVAMAIATAVCIRTLPKMWISFNIYKWNLVEKLWRHARLDWYN